MQFFGVKIWKEWELLLYLPTENHYGTYRSGVMSTHLVKNNWLDTYTRHGDDVQLLTLHTGWALMHLPCRWCPAFDVALSVPNPPFFSTFNYIYNNTFKQLTDETLVSYSRFDHSCWRYWHETCVPSHKPLWCQQSSGWRNVATREGNILRDSKGY